MSRPGKTGSGGEPWVEIETPKPPPVRDPYAYWSEPPPELSARCFYWLRQIAEGWTPNASIGRKGYDDAAHWFGVYIWEYVNVVWPCLVEAERKQRNRREAAARLRERTAR
ncbi:hypothetical protein [Micromonospora carbonacea]|uniref:Uncharacterized protein n=1 Tax=Micromonospora carbonacea TaxID=47853 RepID=A0A1C5ACH9_9ACTN|nr:hypothetical protein [Micromonospora carbonacea]SCF42869.1 hypothetical protein GA0070563_112145 [Micromonospora carbonacea]